MNVGKKYYIHMRKTVMRVYFQSCTPEPLLKSKVICVTDRLLPKQWTDEKVQKLGSFAHDPHQ